MQKRNSIRRDVNGRRRGAALLAALFVMSVTSMIVIGILQTETVQFTALHNTIEYDRSRYLAEAGVHHGLSQIERNIEWRGTISKTEFPPGSGEFYRTKVEDGPGGTVLVTGWGVSGSFSRSVQVQVKQGG